MTCFLLFLVSAAPGDNIHIHVTPRLSRRKIYIMCEFNYAAELTQNVVKYKLTDIF